MFRVSRQPMPVVAIAVALIAPLLSSCLFEAEIEFTPASFIEKVRVLGIRAEPPEIRPGEETVLDALVVDPSQSDSLTRVWLLCDPHPSGLVAGACSQQDTVRDIAKVLAGEVDGVRIAFGERPTYRAPEDAISRLPDGSRGRTTGVNATALLIVFDGPIDQLEDGAEPAVMALKSIRIVDRDDRPLNRNPTIEEIRLDGAALPPNEASSATSGTLSLSALASDDSAESYVREQPDGTTEEQREEMVFSWFTTAGRYDTLTDRSARTIGDATIELDLPPAAEASQGVAEIVVVLRDARGGADWARRTIVLVP